MSSLKKNFIYNTLYQFLTIFIPLITTPYLSRVLGAKSIGIYSYNFSVTNYFALFILLGLNNYGNRTIARVRDDYKKKSETFWNIYSIQFLSGIIVLIAYFIYYFTLLDDKKMGLIMLLFLFSGILDINWFFFGIEKFKLTVTRNTFIKLLSTLLIFIFVKNKNDIYIYSFIMVSSMLLSQIILWTNIHKEILFIRPSVDKIKIHVKPNFLLFYTVIAVSLFKILDKIMLGVLATSQQVGYYELSERLLMVPISLIVSLGTVMLPRISNMIDDNFKGILLIINKSVKFAIAISSLLCFGIMGVSKEFVPLFFGSGYEPVIMLILVLMPSCIFVAFANVIRTQFLLPKQMDKPYVKSAIYGAIVNIIINLLLIPQIGALGTAIGTLLAEIIVAIYQTWSVRENLPIKNYIMDSLPFVFSGVLMFLLMINLNIYLHSLFSIIVIKSVIGLIFFVLFSQFQFFISKNIFNKRKGF